METTIQTLLNATRYKAINAHREFTRLLFPMLLRKLRKSMPELLDDSALLAHTIYQSLVFDGQVKEDGFGLNGTFETWKLEGKVEDWQGVSDAILGHKEWFDTWLEGERRCKCRTSFNVNISPNYSCGGSIRRIGTFT